MLKKGSIKDQLKPYLRELPRIVKDLIGDRHFLYPIKGDGACGLRTGAAWIFQDQTLGPYLAREINRIFVENWVFGQDYFTIPFIRNVKSGKKVEKKTKEELFEYLINSERRILLSFAVCTNSKSKLLLLMVNVSHPSVTLNQTQCW